MCVSCTFIAFLSVWTASCMMLSRPRRFFLSAQSSASTRFSWVALAPYCSENVAQPTLKVYMHTHAHFNHCDGHCVFQEHVCVCLVVGWPESLQLRHNSLAFGLMLLQLLLTGVQIRLQPLVLLAELIDPLEERTETLKKKNLLSNMMDPLHIRKGDMRPRPNKSWLSDHIRWAAYIVAFF